MAAEDTGPNRARGESNIRPIAYQKAPPAPSSLRAPQLSYQSVSSPQGVGRGTKLALSAFVAVGLPILVATIYYLFIASDQYTSVAQFAIRAQTGVYKIDESQSLGSGANVALPAIADTFIVSDYIESNQILEDLNGRVNLRAIYSHPNADFLTRLDPTVSDQGLLSYWQGVNEVHYDLLTGITTLKVRAFTPEDAQAVAQAVLTLSEDLVNRLSDRARNDTLQLARGEVDGARKRLDETMAALENFQRREKQLDPTTVAKTRTEIQGKLEGSIVELEAQLASIKSTNENSPSKTWMTNRLAVLRDQLENEKRRSTNDAEASGVVQLVSNFNRLQLEQEFAAKAYTSALSSLESARYSAIMQSRYLVTFVRPKLPDISDYPDRAFSIGSVALIGSLVWLLAWLVYSVVREHV